MFKLHLTTEGIMNIQRFLVLLFAMLILPACDDDEAIDYNLAGTWVGSYDGISGSGVLTSILDQTGNQVTGTYMTVEDTGTVAGSVDGKRFEATLTSTVYLCESYLHLTIQDSTHISGYYAGYDACADSGSISLTKQ